MKFYPGDRVADITTGSDTAAVVINWVDIREVTQENTVERIVMREGVFFFDTCINARTGEGLPAHSTASVTIRKLSHRPWYNHLRAIFNP